ncbi:MAG: hypothetical protein M3014_09365 [Chloroflexota bacterium]|nr:hypothetical protein [Chloroflexota bacterium]
MQNRLVTKRKNQAQPTPGTRRKLPSSLQVVPRNMLSAAEQSISGIKPNNLLKYVDFHPALSVLTGVAIIALVSFIYLTQVTAVSNANYTFQALQRKHDTLLRERGDLQLQIGRAQALPNIERVARDTLHMVPLGNSYSYIPIPAGPITAMPPAPASGVADATPVAGVP